MRIIDQDPPCAPTNSRFGGISRAGALAAVAAALVFRRNLDAEYALLSFSGLITVPAAAPDTILGWFRLLQARPLTGLLLLSFFDLVNLILVGLIFFAVIVALRESSPAAAAMGGLLALTGIIGNFASNPALRLLSLSAQFATAVGEIQRTALLASGEALLAGHHANSFAGSGIYPSFLFVSLAGLLLAAAMRRAPEFSRQTALCGILANLLGLAYYPVLFAAPAFTWLPLSFSAIFLLAWYLMVASRLWALAASTSGWRTRPAIAHPRHKFI